ncbi:MAG: flagellar hook protein [Lachnospiraceae bacterium]|nr:flagellar hook protein [Lachnospiraceae bacterium]
MVVAHNLMAMNAQRQFKLGNSSKKKSAEKLSSGYRINRAADDASGLAISEKMRRQIRGLDQGADNIKDGISLVQVADGALAEVQDMLHRMTELSVKSANDTNSPEDRLYIQQEINQLANEIDRIGKNTTYNEMPLFDDMFGMDAEGSVTNLVSSPAAEKGYLTESYQVGSKFYPCASIDFSGINDTNINKLNGQGFSFTCSDNCNEVFDIKFATDGTPSSSSNLSGQVRHYYVIDISDCNNGTGVVDKIYSYIKANIPNGYSSTGTIKPDALYVSHSNELIKSDDGNKLVIASNVASFSNKNAAETKYPIAGYPNSGKIDCSELASLVEDEKINEIKIQCSSNHDTEIIHTHRMNANILGVRRVNVTSAVGAGKSLSVIEAANKKISSQRSELGAFQNRLEHALRINQNVSENTSAAESAIRDTDMAKEMMNYSLHNILEQAGVSMMAQANQINQEVLSLLQ